MKIYHVKAFCHNNKGGNPAGIVLNADLLSQADMQSTAKDLNYSETVFVSSSDLADYKVKFFTPNAQVDLCGHGTIAAFHVLFDQNIIGPGHYKQETLAGILSIDLDEKGRVFMDQPLPESFGEVSKDLVADSLGIDPREIIGPVEIISTGLKDIIIHIKDSHVLEKIKADFKKIKAISSEFEVVGYHVFSSPLKSDYKARCRNFAPLYGIDEEAATGTASGALTAYIVRHLDNDLKDGLYTWSYEQGLEMNQASKIDIKFTIKSHQLTKLSVGGQAIIYNPK